ncbi:NIPSNAP family protein [Chitinophaga nivalis]|uniref:NIPSNAP family protein n=1 Tax=Chitinophaga nivalis TaxID=2991709 RepID=A0ABT3IJK2_9BACT|nr:NIPSNAP family protein [Chitinophaga nivalis]MCW3466168.1 NIPSNAP family protein [Chitinophaga nivalis]MCW3484141.1 NIPSNAP family protein [Chitinophaga nivalis]
MQRRKFLRSSLAVTAGIAATLSPAIAQDKPSSTQKELYEWREYEIRFGSDLEQLEKYFKTALIPALNKYGVKNVGVFKEWRPSEPAKIYLLTPYASLEQYLSVPTQIKADAAYLKNCAPYSNIPADKAVYNRFTASLMMAFDGFPAMVVPSGTSRIFELRTYEGYSEDAVRRKIDMFHDGEFPIFKRAKLNPVFFGEVIAGDKLPRLTYLITCNSMEERDKGWSAFVADPEWKKLVANPRYAYTISKISNTFLVPTAYSQV